MIGDRYSLPSVAQVSEEFVHISQHLHLFDRFEKSESEVVGRSLLPNAGTRAHAARRSGPVFTFAST